MDDTQHSNMDQGGPTPQRMYTPPPLTPVQPAPRPKKRIGWIITSVVLFCLLMLSLFGNFIGMIAGVEGGSMSSGGPRLEEAVIEAEQGQDKIAVIHVAGIIMSESVDGEYNMVDLISAQLKRAKEEKSVKAVVLRVDSPGGEVLASDEIYKAIQNFQKETQKPVVASMGSLAASGGYYVSAPCQWIVANEMTITGSIGVIMSGFNYRGLMDKIGLRPEVFKSGKFKDMLRGSKSEGEITAEERQMIQNLIDETYGRFKEIVKEGREYAQSKNSKKMDRGRALASDWVKYADGRILSGREAEKLGFVDELGNFKTAVARAKKLASVDKASLVEYKPLFNLANLFRLFGKSDAKKVNVQVNLGPELPKVQAGKLYFLCPTYLY